MGKMKHNVHTRQQAMRLIAVRIDGSAVTTSSSTAGLLEGAQEVTVKKGSGATSNDVTITFNEAFARVPTVVPASATTNVHVDIKTLAADSIVLETFQVADGTTGVDDADLHVLIMGSGRASAN